MLVWKQDGPTTEATVDIINERDPENEEGFRGAYDVCNDSNGMHAICDELEEDVILYDNLLTKWR